MDVASRPSLELLPDLPLEEPLDGAAARGPPTVAAAPAAAAASAASKDPAQTDLHFIDPELFMTPDQAAAVAPPPPSPPPAPRGTPESELTLEDPVIDEMLTAPPPPPVRTAEPPTLSAAAAPKPASDVPPRSTRVPIAKTASLSAAAAKLAAASAAQQRPMKAQAITPPPVLTPSRAAAAKPETPGARVEEAKGNGSKEVAAKAAAPKPGAAKADTAGMKSAAAGLAEWASARSAAATPSAKPPPGKTPASVADGVRAAAAAAPVAKSAAPKIAAAPQVQAEPASSSASPPMDRDFIARNQVVERYLSGRLPLKGATDFERYCHAHPEILDEIGLPERVNAGLRLLEASGKPEPWQEAPRPLWHRPQVTLSLAAAVIVLGVALAAVGAGSAVKNQRIASLQKQAFERALDPATSTREIRLLPSREGASNSPAITIGGGSVQLADFKIDETRSPYHAFRVTIDRIDQGRVGVITNLTKDTNGHLRIALNSSALGPGSYQLTIEGLNWRGEPEPDSWVTIGILR